MKQSNKLLLFLFFLSGAAALVYEISWLRKLELIFGTTAYAASTVLAVFFTGLALGSYLFGRLADKLNAKWKIRGLLVLLAALEFGVATYAILTPTLFKLMGLAQVLLAKGLGYGFTGFNLTTLLLSLIVLIIPSTLIGGTLPVFVKYFFHSRLGRLGQDTGLVYGVNTLGAVLGTILSGFILVFFLGINGTIFFASAMNALTGIAFFLLSKKESVSGQNAGKKTINQLNHKTLWPEKGAIILSAFFFSGFAALTLEVLWTRVLVLAIGTTLYSFSIILTAFILGLALGSLIISGFVQRINALSWLIGLFFALGLSVIAAAFLLGSLPLVFFSLVKTFETSSFFGVQVIGFLISLLILLIPTTLMGASFPLGVRLYAEGKKNPGARVGTLYSINTIGGVAGSLIGGFVFLPALGLQRSVVATASIYLSIASFLLFSLAKRRGLAVGGIVVGAVFVLIGLSVAPWQKGILTSGLYLNIDYPDEASRESLRRLLLLEDLIYYKEGVSSTVSVFDDGRTRYLRINGKTDASTSSDDMPAQLLIGHLPMLLHRQADSALVIGLGSGISLGAVEQYSVKTIDAVEIEPAVVEAAGYFSDFNHNALEDPRLRIVVDDARNFLKVTDTTYDVITSEPSNFWIQGNYNLFTREFYQLVESRLSEDGVFLQWIHSYETDTESLKMAIATLRSVFPFVSVWSSPASYGDLLLVASETPLEVKASLITEKLADEKIQGDLEKAHIINVEDFLAYLFLDHSQVENFVKDASIHTDDWPILGLKSPFSLYRLYAIAENVAELTRFQDNDRSEMIVFESNQQKEMVKKLRQARQIFAQGLLLVADKKIEEATGFYEKALELYPGQPQMRASLGLNYLYLIDQYRKAGNIEKARYYADKVNELSKR